MVKGFDMSIAQPRKEFSVERMMKRKRAAFEGTEVNDALPTLESGEGTAILEAITALREEVAELKVAANKGGVVATANTEEDDDLDEMAKDVRVEIAQMVRVIAKTKQEIAQIKHPFVTDNDDQLVRAHSELDEIVLATEQATQGILEATEQMETGLSTIAAMADEEQDMLEAIDRLNDNVTTILEACNFQDITGQRITKVVKTVRFIEDRILAMISIWGAEAFEDLPVPIDESAEEGEPGDEALLQGPQLGNEGISQAEIDALFD